MNPTFKYIPINALNVLDLLTTKTLEAACASNPMYVFGEHNPLYFVPGFDFVKLALVVGVCLLVEYGIRRFKSHFRRKFAIGMQIGLFIMTCVLLAVCIRNAHGIFQVI